MYELTLSSDYLKHWTVEDAVRELFQNAIDFSEDGELDFIIKEDHELQINTKGVSLHPSVLLLGSGDKSEDNTKLGGFGEGMKVALLILAREGVDVVMHNGDKIWKPAFVFNEHFGTKMLCIIEEDNLEEDIGIRYTIKGLKSEEIINIIDRTLPTQKYIGIETEYGEVLTEEGFISKVFVGGLYICDVAGLQYGYNFNKGTLPLNRDRQTVPDWDVSKMTDRMLAVALPPEEYVKLVAEQAKDVYHARYNYQDPSVCAVANNNFVEEHGVRPVANSNAEVERLKKEGYTNPYLEPNDGLYNLITSAPSYNKGEKKEILTLEAQIIELFEKSVVVDYIRGTGEGQIEEDFYELMHKVLRVIDEHG
jgi:hypothetical protein